MQTTSPPDYITFDNTEMDDFKKIQDAKNAKIAEYVENAMNFTPDADKNVLTFIFRFLLWQSPVVSSENSRPHPMKYDPEEIIRSQFRSGFCWYFAVMLKSVFSRGEICWAAPFSHIVWLDDNDIAYDIEGVYYGEAEELIPVSYLGPYIKAFSHAYDTDTNPYYAISKETIQDIMTRYVTDIIIDAMHSYENIVLMESSQNCSDDILVNLYAVTSASVLTPVPDMFFNKKYIDMHRIDIMEIKYITQETLFHKPDVKNCIVCFETEPGISTTVCCNTDIPLTQNDLFHIMLHEFGWYAACHINHICRQNANDKNIHTMTYTHDEIKNIKDKSITRDCSRDTERTNEK